MVEDLLGKGIYTIPEAARILRVPISTMRHWLTPKTYHTSTGPIRLEPIVSPQHAKIGNEHFLSFLDLMELYAIQELRQSLSVRLIHQAHIEAKKIFRHEHPFALEAFQTDGRSIFVALKNSTRDEEDIIELDKAQLCFTEAIKPFLTNVEFDQGIVNQWRPLGPQSPIVVNPERAFGEPVLENFGIRTRTLYLAIQTGDTIEEVSQMYEVTREAVEEAVSFEESLKAA